MTVLGVTLGEVAAAIYMLLRAAATRRAAVAVHALSDSVRPVGQLAKTLLSLSIPITISSAVMSLTDLIDVALIASRLQSPAVGMDAVSAMNTYGVYTNMAINFFNLPQTLITALAVSVLPTIASARAAHNHDKVAKTLSTTMRMTLIITLPAGAGFLLLSGPILRMFYSENTVLGGQLMGILGFAVPAVALVAVTNAVLQAFGRIDLPLVSMFCGAVVKMLGDYCLIGRPEINIAGAPISTAVCYWLIALINLFHIGRLSHALPPVGKTLGRPLAATVGMGAATYIAHTVLLRVTAALPGTMLDKLVTLAAIGSGSHRVCRAAARTAGGGSRGCHAFAERRKNREYIALKVIGSMKMVDFKQKEQYDFNDLLRIMEILRAPDGCMWDREQDHHSIRRNFIEETYEVCEAIDEDDTEHMKEELGDVLLQVVFHTQMEKEKGVFDINDVADGICKKLIFRHPHIFGDVEVSSSEEILSNWDDLKRKEKHQETDTSALASVAKSLPGLIRAEKLQKKAAKVGFDWPDAQGALDKVDEELDEVRRAMQGDGDPRGGDRRSAVCGGERRAPSEGGHGARDGKDLQQVRPSVCGYGNTGDAEEQNTRRAVTGRVGSAVAEREEKRKRVSKKREAGG